jgi:type IV secretory pathway TraG/TraD family ATPase VirD4
MKTLNRIPEYFFNLAGEYIDWLIIPFFEVFPAPRMSLIVTALWSAIFLLWFVSQSIQAGDDSKLEILFNKFRRILIAALILFFISIAAAAGWVSTYLNHSDRAINWLINYLAKPLIVSLVCITILSLVVGWLCLRNWIPSANRWITQKATKKSYHDAGISDIRDISKLIPIVKEYNPIKYWDKSKKSFFIGLDPTNKPVYVSHEEWRTQHQQVLGTTGFGKGVAVTNQLAQCLAFGQSVVVFDPKNDEWAPSVLLAIAEHYNRPICVIDLNDDSPQFNPLYGANEIEIYDLFIGGFGLAESGGIDDFYRSEERRVIQGWLSNLAGGVSLKALADSLTEADFKNAAKLCNGLTELAMLGCIHTNQKGAWHDIIDQGGLVYVIGSVRREPVLRLQKILLLRIMQRLEKRDRCQKHRHVTIFLDELKYLLCKPSLQALGTIRDKSANILLAHQSINDLRDVPADLDPEAVKSAVLENTALKIVYRSQDPETAEWIAKRSGTIPAHKEMRDIEITEGLAEVTKSNRRLLEVERYLVEVNTILSMPKRCSVFFSNESAQIVLTSPIKVEKRDITPSLVDISKENVVEQPGDETKLGLFS